MDWKSVKDSLRIDPPHLCACHPRHLPYQAAPSNFWAEVGSLVYVQKLALPGDLQNDDLFAQLLGTLTSLQGGCAGC